MRDRNCRYAMNAHNFSTTITFLLLKRFIGLILFRLNLCLQFTVCYIIKNHLLEVSWVTPYTLPSRGSISNTDVYLIPP